jgi:hypothetical protein
MARANSRAFSLIPAVSIDLVADDATDHGATHHTDRAAACKDRTTERTDAGADRGVLIPRRHSAATTEQHRCQNRAHCKASRHFHWNTFLN